MNLVGIDDLSNVTVLLEVHAGSRFTTLEEVAALDTGAAISAGKPAGEGLDVFVADIPIATAEAVVIEDKLAIRITDLLPAISARENVPPRASAGTATEPESDGPERLPPAVSGLCISMHVTLGRTALRLREVFKLDSGTIVDMGRPVTEPAELVINGKVAGKGKIVVIDGNYGLKLLAKASSS